MTETEALGDELRRSLPNIKNGSLRFWGVWFGGPYDAFKRNRKLRCRADFAAFAF